MMVMGARLRIFLNQKEDRTLRELRTATTVPQRVKDRAEMLRLNHRGWYIEDIAVHFDCHRQTVRQAIHQWQKLGLGGLWERKGRGGKKRYSDEDLEYLEQSLEHEQRTYNSKQLSQKLATERQVKLSPEHLRRVLKKRG